MMSQTISKVFTYTIVAMLVSLLVAMTVLTTGCKTTKKTATKEVSSEVVNADSVVNEKALEVNRDSDKETEITLKDTTIGVAGADVKYSGDADTVIKKGNITLKTWTDRKGVRHTECKADSLTMVIRGLVRERMKLIRTVDSMAFASHYKKDSNTVKVKAVERTAEVKKTGAGWAKVAMWLLIAFVAGMAAQRWVTPIIKRFVTWQISGR